MKNLLKFSVLAIAISLSVAACGDTGKNGKGVDSAAVDTPTVNIDTPAVDTLAKDSTVKDKVETTTPEIKK